MVVALLRTTASLLLVASAVLLATSSGQHHQWFYYAAAVVVAVPASFRIRTFVPDKISGPLGRQREHSIDAALRAGVITLYRMQFKRRATYPGDISQVGFHLWLVPRAYRWMIPYRLRTVLLKWMPDPLKNHLPQLRLDRAGVFRLDHQDATGLTFRKGRGIVGTCLLFNRLEKIEAINWERPDRAEILQREDRAAWDAAGDEVNHRIPYDDAIRLSEVYGQAAAVVVRRPGSNEAIGVVTIDLPKNLPISIEDQSGSTLTAQLKAVRDQIQKIQFL